MLIDVTGTEEYACEAYKKLFEDIMNDVGKATMIDRAKLVLKPEVPLFIFSVRLINEPTNKVVSDAADLRQEGSDTHVSISDERYAPEIIASLWKNYGRDKVEQQTRFDLTVYGGDENAISNYQISSGEEAKKEIIGALWRVMPEGIKNRHNMSDGNVITIVATEELMHPEMIDEGVSVHKSMKEVA